MPFTLEQEKELEELKQKHKKELLLIQSVDAQAEHERKMQRLGKLLEIAQSGGAKAGGV